MLNKINEMINAFENKDKNFKERLEEINSEKEALEKDKEVNNVRLSLLRLASLPSYVIDDLFIHSVEKLTSNYLPEGKQMSIQDIEEELSDDYDYSVDDVEPYDEVFPPVFDEEDVTDDFDEDDGVSISATTIAVTTGVSEPSTDKSGCPSNPHSESMSSKSFLNSTPTISHSPTTEVKSKNDFYDEMISSVDELENYGKKIKSLRRLLMSCLTSCNYEQF